MTVSSLSVPNWLHYFVVFLVALYPIAILSVAIMSGLIMLLLLLVSLFFIFKNIKNIVLTSADKQIIFALVFIFIVSVFVSFNDLTIAQKKLSKLIVIPLAVPIYILLRQLKSFETLFWIAMAIGALVAGGIALYEVSELNLHRAKGVTHPIIFGNTALLMGSLSLFGFKWYRQRHKLLVIVPIIAFIAGVSASILSESRGGWVAIPAIFILLLFYFRTSFKAFLLMGLVFVVTLFALYSIPQIGVDKRIDKTINNIQLYVESDVQSKLRKTSIGTRFEMWQASIEIFKQHPWLGVGWGQYRAQAQIQVDAKMRNSSAVSWGHPHNEYFSVAVAGGLLGLLALFILLLLPLWLFFKGLKTAKGDDSIFYAGVVHIVLYMHFALSESVLERSLSVTTFALYLVVILALANSKSAKLADNKA